MEKKQPLYLTANEHHGERERYWPRQLTADTWPWAEPSLSNMFKWVSGLAFRNTHARRRCSPIKSGENPMWVWFNLGSPKPHPRLKFLQVPCRKQCLTPLCASPECLTEVWEKTNNSPSSGRGKKKTTTPWISNSGRQRDWCASLQNHSDAGFSPPSPHPPLSWGFQKYPANACKSLNLSECQV